MERFKSNIETKKSCNRGHWRPAEDERLKQLVNQCGPKNWNFISEQLQGRSGKSCRLRWYNQLDPNIIKKAFSNEEEEMLLALQKVKGNKWAAIARYFPGRTDNAVKNHFHVLTARRQRERLTLFGADTTFSTYNSSISRINNSYYNFNNLQNYTKKTELLFGMSSNSSKTISSAITSSKVVSSSGGEKDLEHFPSILGSYHSFTAPGLPCIGKVVPLIQHNKFISNSMKTGKCTSEKEQEAEESLDLKQKGVVPSFIDFLGVGSSSSVHDDETIGGP